MKPSVIRAGVSHLFSNMKWRKIEGVNKLHIWTLENAIKSRYFFDQIEIHLISDNADDECMDIIWFDLKKVGTVIEMVDYYIEKSIAFMKSELLLNPELFGLTISRVEKYRNIAIEKFPVDMPEINFYLNSVWCIRYMYADFSLVEYGLGILIFLMLMITFQRLRFLHLARTKQMKIIYRINSLT